MNNTYARHLSCFRVCLLPSPHGERRPPKPFFFKKKVSHPASYQRFVKAYMQSLRLLPCPSHLRGSALDCPCKQIERDVTKIYAGSHSEFTGYYVPHDEGGEPRHVTLLGVPFSSCMSTTQHRPKRDVGVYWYYRIGRHESTCFLCHVHTTGKVCILLLLLRKYVSSSEPLAGGAQDIEGRCTHRALHSTLYWALYHLSSEFRKETVRG
jgi:hypothetical protein